MIPQWIKQEAWTGEGDPNGKADVFNRPNREIWESFLVQHAKDGSHYTFPFGRFEEGSYTGNNTDDTTITLTDSDLTIVFLMIFSEEDFGFVYASSDMTADDTKPLVELGQGTLPDSSNSQAFTSNLIQDISTAGEFEIGSHAAVNTNSAAYEYLAIGYYA